MNRAHHHEWYFVSEVMGKPAGGLSLSRQPSEYKFVCRTCGELEFVGPKQLSTIKTPLVGSGGRSAAHQRKEKT